jgi:hypothetical protein
VKALALTAHAQHVVRERGIDLAWIERAARNPEWTETDPSGVERRFQAVSERQNRILRIVCTETDTEVRVITAFFDRNARRPR